MVESGVREVPGGSIFVRFSAKLGPETPLHFLDVLKQIFNFLLGPGGPGGGSGLPCSSGNRRFWADSGPNPEIFNFYFGPTHS